MIPSFEGGEDRMIMELIAVGDAFGFPVECGYSGKIDGFVSFEVGDFSIKAGEYSDDTQLTLSIARSIWEGKFHPEYFAYIELPLWIYYQRGAGKSTLRAAFNLISPRIQWYSNYYPGYEDAGGDGAAMRISPLVLIHRDLEGLVKDVVRSTIITHGNPIALVGSLALATAQFSSREEIKDLKRAISDAFDIAKDFIEEDEIMKSWKRGLKEDYVDGFVENEMVFFGFFEKMKDFQDYSSWCKHVGEYKNPGMAMSSVLCAIFIFEKFKDNPFEGLLRAASEKGTDTDTIASMAAGIFGFYLKEMLEELKNLADQVQDAEYIASLEKDITERGGRPREAKREDVRRYAAELEGALKDGRLPEAPHPVFGRLEIKGRVHRYILTESEEGQTLFFKTLTR